MKRTTAIMLAVILVAAIAIAHLSARRTPSKRKRHSGSTG